MKVAGAAAGGRVFIASLGGTVAVLVEKGGGGGAAFETERLLPGKGTTAWIIHAHSHCRTVCRFEVIFFGIRKVDPYYTTTRQLTRHL